MREQSSAGQSKKRIRRVIALFNAEQFALLEATALMCGYPTADEYARDAILERVESDRQKIKNLMEKERKKGRES